MVANRIDGVSDCSSSPRTLGRSGELAGKIALHNHLDEFKSNQSFLQESPECVANDSRNGALSHRSLHFRGAAGDHGHLCGGDSS